MVLMTWMEFSIRHHLMKTTSKEYPVNISRTPAYSTLYDHFVELQAQRALQGYNSALPTFLDKKVVEDPGMLEQLAVAERILYSFSQAFGLTNNEGVSLDKLCSNAATRTSAELTHMVSTFTYLSALMSHPAYTMLATTRAVHDRQKPLGALRDIRWIYKAEHQGLIITDESKIFRELAAQLYQITRCAASSTHPVTQTALTDFEGYVYDEDGTNLITSINFGTAAVLTQNVVESSKRLRA